MHARAKRPSGGISVLIRHKFRGLGKQKDVQIIKENDLFVWLKLNKDLIGSIRDVYICALYVPPKDSSFWNTHRDCNPYNLLEQDIVSYQREGDIMLLGDFNARTGNKSDYVSDFNEESVEDFARNTENYILEQLGRVHRINADDKTNTYGNHVLDLCKGLNLRILNGRTFGDSAGEFTCFHYNGKSTVDYCIVSENIIHSIPSLKISPPTHLSDHAHLSCIMNISPNMGKLKNSNQNNSIEKHKILTKYKWDIDAPIKFKNALKIAEISRELNNLQSGQYELNHKSTNRFCERFTNIIIKAAKLCLKTNNKIKKCTKPNKVGFDYECKALKNYTLSLGKLVQKYPKDPIIYGKFISTKKLFKKTVKNKYKMTKDLLIQRIMSCEEKDPKTFWKLLKDLKDKKTINNLQLILMSGHSILVNCTIQK